MLAKSRHNSLVTKLKMFVNVFVWDTDSQDLNHMQCCTEGQRKAPSNTHVYMLIIASALISRGCLHLSKSELSSMT